jgi:hypothetical protein
MSAANCGSVDAGNCIVWGCVPGSVVVVVVEVLDEVVVGGAVVVVVRAVALPRIVGDDSEESSAKATPPPTRAAASAMREIRRNRDRCEAMALSAPFSGSGAARPS